MNGKVFAMLLAGMMLCLTSYKQSAYSASLTEAEVNGKKMFQQRCSVCHTAPIAGSRVYGPLLGANNVNGKEAAVRMFIMKGTTRMPGFQYGLEPGQIDNIIAYLKTVQKIEQKQTGTQGPRD